METKTFILTIISVLGLFGFQAIEVTNQINPFFHIFYLKNYEQKLDASLVREEGKNDEIDN